jgi:hypothetical protein
MGKMKKKFKKKVNPERSNKMIIAIAGGLVVVFAVLFILTTGRNSTPVDKNEVMNSTLKYLEKSEGLLALRKFPEQNKVVIVYDSYTKNKDFRKIALYAGIKLSHKIGDEILMVELLKDKEEEKVCTFVLRDGRLIGEEVK